MSNNNSRKVRYITMFRHAIHIVISQNYWNALKSAQAHFDSQTGIRVWRDTLSTR